MKERVIVGPKEGSGFVIRELWAVVVVLDDTDEGIPAVHSPPGIRPPAWVPLVGADPARVDWMIQEARNHARRVGKPARLVKFTVREDVEVFHPDGRRERP